jgi:ABC-type uncharacterized transport system auxiliary subunit
VLLGQHSERQARAVLDSADVSSVRRVNIAPPFDGPTFIYRSAEGTYVKDYYSEWVAPPEELFSTQLVDWLRVSGPFESVVDGQSAAPHRFALETCITSFYGGFQDSLKPGVVLSARVYVIDESAGNRTVVYQNHYDNSIPIASASVQRLVRGTGRAYRQLLESMTKDLSTFRKTIVAADTR